MKKKYIALVLAFVLVAALSVGGTLAWLTAKTDAVTNIFTTAGIDITLTETFNTDTNDDGTNDKWEAQMVPGYTLSKDPKVTVKANSEACWLFVKLDKSANFDTYLTYEMADGWIQLEDDKEGTVEGVFYRQVSLATTDQEFSVLKDNQVKVKGSVTKTQMDAAETNYPTLTVTAYAHQYSKDGSNYFGVYDAWKELNS